MGVGEAAPSNVLNAELYMRLALVTIGERILLIPPNVKVGQEHSYFRCD